MHDRRREQIRLEADRVEDRVAAKGFGDRCIAGLRWNAATIAGHLDGSLQGAVEAMAEQGYAAVATARIAAGAAGAEVIQ